MENDTDVKRTLSSDLSEDSGDTRDPRSSLYNVQGLSRGGLPNGFRRGSLYDWLRITAAQLGNPTVAYPLTSLYPCSPTNATPSGRNLIELYIWTCSIKLMMIETAEILVQSRTKACGTCITRKSKVGSSTSLMLNIPCRGFY